MLFRLANYAVMGIALFYAAEGSGAIERGRYFPTLPRLEASASDPAAWFGAMQWGVTALVQGAGGTSGGQSYSSPSQYTAGYGAETPTSPLRLGAYAAEGGSTLKRMVGYYGG